MSNLPIPFCVGCNKPASEIEEYILGAEEAEMKVEDYARQEEGTYNPVNGHLLCTPCYIDAGMPANPHPQPNWVAP